MNDDGNTEEDMMKRGKYVEGVEKKARTAPSPPLWLIYFMFRQAPGNRRCQ